VGQIINRFSTRFSAYQSTWKADYTRVGLEDKAALDHFYHHHFEFFNQNPDITQCFKVIFCRNLKIKNISTFLKANGLVN